MGNRSSAHKSNIPPVSQPIPQEKVTKNAQITYSLRVHDNVIRLQITAMDDDFRAWIDANPYKHKGMRVDSNHHVELTEEVVWLKGSAEDTDASYSCACAHDAEAKAMLYREAIDAAVAHYLVVREQKLHSEPLRYELTCHCNMIYFTVLAQNRDFTQWLAKNPQTHEKLLICTHNVVDISTKRIYLLGKNIARDSDNGRADTPEIARRFCDRVRAALDYTLEQYWEYKLEECKTVFVAMTDRLSTDKKLLLLDDTSEWVTQLRNELLATTTPQNTPLDNPIYPELSPTAPTSTE